MRVGDRAEALRQILENRYNVGLSGEVLCVGNAHNRKLGEMADQVINV